MLCKCFVTDDIKDIREGLLYAGRISEYASQVWCPGYLTEIDHFERVQRYLPSNFSALSLMRQTMLGD